MKPIPHPNAVTQHFWSGCQAGRFEFQTCSACGRSQFPPRLRCASCHAGDLGWRTASGKGTIYSFSLVHRAPLDAFKADTPYVIAIVELEEGVRAMMNVRGSDPGELSIGTPVEIFFEAAEGCEYPLPQARRRG